MDQPNPRRHRAGAREADRRRPRGAVDRGMGGPRAPTASTGARPASRSSPSTPRRRPSAARCTWGTCSPTPTPTRRPLPADARARGLLPDGLGRQRPAHRAPGPELLRGPVRPDAALRPGTSRQPAKPDPGAGADLAGATSSSCASGSPPRTSRPSRTCGAWLGLSVDWTQTYTTIDDASRTASQRAFLRNLARGEAYQAEAPSLWDVTFQTAVAQAELEDREAPGLPPGRVPFRRRRGSGPHRDHPARADPGLRRAGRPPGRRALPAPLRYDRPHAALRRRGAGAPTTWPSRTRAPASRWSAPSATSPTSPGGASSTCPCGPWSAATAGSCARRPSGWPAADRPAAYAEIAGKTTFSAQAAVVELLRASGDLDGEPDAHRADQLLRERRPPARDRDQPPVVHPQRRPRRGPAGGAARARPRDRLASRLHAAPLRELGQRAARRLAGQPAALLRRALPGLVPRSTPTGSRLRRPHPRRRGRPAGRPGLDCTRPATPRTSATCRAASPPTPT